MSEEIDLHRLIELLDAALVSKDENVQKALRKFLFITALALDTGDDREMGPIESILKGLEARVSELERRNMYAEPFETKKYGPPLYPPSIWTSGGTSAGSGTFGGGTGGSSTTTITYLQSMADALSELDAFKAQAIEQKLSGEN
jgi:hypothetical protein